MADLCSICEEILGERPRTELLCHHFFHTECVLTNIANGHPDQMDLLRCVTCQEAIFNAVEDQEEEEDNTSVVSNNSSNHSYATGAAATRVLNLYNANRNFRRDIKTYAHAVSSMSKPRRELQKLIALKKAELAQPYALIKAQYEGLYNTKKDELAQSESYKTYRRTDARAQRLYTNLGTKYRINKNHFAVLQTLPGLKRLRSTCRWRWRYYNRPSALIRRALRLRLPWW